MTRVGRSRSGRVSPTHWLATVGVVASLLVAAIAAPAASASGTQTGTIWVPLICNLGVVTVNFGAAFTATLPTSVSPGQEFNLQNAYATIDVPAQGTNQAAFPFGNPDAIEGVVTTLDTNLSNAIAPTLVDADTFLGGPWMEPPSDGGVSSDPIIGDPKGSPAIVNLVAAEQPPNADAPNPPDPLINGPSPLAGFTDYPEPPLTGVFSWGPAPVDGSGQDGSPGGNPTTDAYAPVPGTGGGSSLTSGTPDPFTTGPIEVTGSSGQDVKLDIGNPSELIKIGKPSYEFAINNDIFFDETVGTPGWSGDTPMECGIDTSANAVPSPDPSYFSVAQGISIPIGPPPAPPTVTSVTPSAGSTAGGTSVTIAGTGFDPTAANDTVAFGSSTARVTAASATSLTVTTPSEPAGAVPVTVTTSGVTSNGTVDYTYVGGAITATSITPSSGSTAGGTTATISGTGFDPTATNDTVTFGSSTATVTAASATSLTVTTPAEAAGTVPVTVTDGNGTSNSVDYTYAVPCTQPPAITTPPSGQTVTVGGSATFTAAASTPPNCAAPSVQWQVSADDGTTWANVDGATSGTLSVSATTTSLSGFEYRAVFTNAAGPTDSPAATLTVDPLAPGTTTVAVWTPLVCSLGTVTVHMASATTATVPTHLTPGEQFSLQDVSTTLDVPAQTLNALAFVFSNPNEIEGAATDVNLEATGAIAPTLVSADTTRVSGGGTWAEPSTDGDVSADPSIGDPTGSPAVVNLVAAAQPPNGDAPSPLDPLVNGPSPIAGFVEYPEPPLMGVFSWGPAPVDGSGTDGTVGGNPTTDTYAPIPGSGGGATVTSGTPDPVTVGPFTATAAGGQSVVLKLGTPPNPPIDSAALVMVNDAFFNETSSSPPEWSGDTLFSCDLDTTNGALPPPGPQPYISDSSGVAIPVMAPPTVTSISPSNGPPAGGNSVTITGTGFDPSPANDTVKFGSNTATVTAASATSLTVTAPAGTGTAAVTVTTSAGTSSSGSVVYTYGPIFPPITISPTSGPTTGGTTVTISGSGFSATASGDIVTFGANKATVTAASTTSLTVTTPPGSAGAVDVTVTTSGGTSSAATFTYIAECTQAPAVTRQPANVSVTAGQAASFTAAGSTPANCLAPSVRWQVSADHGTTWSNVASATSATLTVGSTTTSESGLRYRAVFTNAAGSTDSSPATLTVLPSDAPVVSGVRPSSGGPFSMVIITGRNLGHATEVTFGGHRTLFLAVTGQLVVAFAPFGPSGTVDVQVHTRVGTSPISSADHFTYK